MFEGNLEQHPGTESIGYLQSCNGKLFHAGEPGIKETAVPDGKIVKLLFPAYTPDDKGFCQKGVDYGFEEVKIDLGKPGDEVKAPKIAYPPFLRRSGEKKLPDRAANTPEPEGMEPR
jgi:hypothetical protein